MSAATEDRLTSWRNSQKQNVGVSAGQEIISGTLVCYAADGYLADGADTASYVFAGVADESVDNSAGADGDENCEIYVYGQFKFAAQGLAITDVGKRLYLVDNQTVATEDDADVDNYVYVGRLAEYISATECWVEIEPHQIERTQQFHVQVAGTNAAALDLSTAAADFGGADIEVVAVQSIESYTTATGAADKILAVTTDYTVASGDITMVGDKSTKTLVIALTGRLK